MPTCVHDLFGSGIIVYVLNISRMSSSSLPVSPPITNVRRDSPSARPSSCTNPNTPWPRTAALRPHRCAWSVPLREPAEDMSLRTTALQRYCHISVTSSTSPHHPQQSPSTSHSSCSARFLGHPSPKTLNLENLHIHPLRRSGTAFLCQRIPPLLLLVCCCCTSPVGA